MISIVMALCLVNDLTRCKEQVINLDVEQNITPSNCMLFAMPEMAKYIGEHPNWTITKFKCVQAGTEAKL